MNKLYTSLLNVALQRELIMTLQIVDMLICLFCVSEITRVIFEIKATGHTNVGEDLL